MTKTYQKEIAGDVVQHLEYNAERSHLIIPDYGRHLQKLIDQASAIEDRDERNKTANYIIQVMGNLNPHIQFHRERFCNFDQINLSIHKIFPSIDFMAIISNI